MKRTLLFLGLSMLIASLASIRKTSLAGPDALPVSPVSLSNPDGQELELLKYDLRVAVHGALSLTEMEMTFRNNEGRQMEGRFQYLLPPGATISRFAKEVDGKLMEGEVVETQRARAIYRQVLHTLRDPALLEQDQGNKFSAKVFPIPANGTVRLVLGYTQTLAMKGGQRKLTVPLAGMPKIGEFNFSAVVRGDDDSLSAGSRQGLAVALEQAGALQTFSRRESNFKPEEDLVLDFRPAEGAAAGRALRAGNFEMLRFRPVLPERQGVLPEHWVFYFDTSASNADTEARRLEAVNRLEQELNRAARKGSLTAYAFDMDVERVQGYPLTAERDSLPKPVSWMLRQRHNLGATDLAAALKHLGEQARGDEKAQQFVLVSDGIATWGPTEAGEVVKALGAWPANDTLHALVIGNKQDAAMLNAIVEHTRGRVVTWALNKDFEKDAGRVLGELATPIGATFEFYAEGAEWLFPKRFTDVRAGDELIAFAQLEEGKSPKAGVIQRGLDGKVLSETALDAAPTEVSGFAPLLEREAYRACLAHLEKAEQNAGESRKAELRKQRIELSVKHRVLCPLTSLLVLETENDYERFGIDRKALADVLVVDANGIALKHRAEDDLALRPMPERPARRRQARGELKQAEQAAGEEAAEEALNKEADKADAESMDLAGLVIEKMRLMNHGDEENLERGYLREGQGAGQLAGRLRPLADTTGVDDGRADERIAVRESAAPAGPPATAAPATDPATTGRSAEAGAVPAMKPKRPEWVGQYNRKPSEGELKELLAKVQAAPLDRMLRNGLAEAEARIGNWDALLAECFEWLPFDAENPQVYEHLGTAAGRLGDAKTALRAFASVAEVAPRNAAYLERAGYLLLVAGKYDLAETMFRRALKERDDNANIHRGLAFGLWMAGRHAEAANVLENALGKTFDGRYGDVQRVMKEELGYVLRAWQAAWAKEPRQQGEQESPARKLAAKLGIDLQRTDALRVTLAWETDANDVDLHIVDPSGEECFYSHKQNASGLELYSDQTQGLGPEVIRTDRTQKGLYHVGVKYYNPGPMGVSRGVVFVLHPDAEGNLAQPRVVPFCLVPNGEEVRHLLALEF
ncbi:MAG: VIT domain-containing protein [Planctomycetota bacterium]|nr:VIT domain-containing protein [Planctomycetota bacterium]